MHCGVLFFAAISFAPVSISAVQIRANFTFGVDNHLPAGCEANDYSGNAKSISFCYVQRVYLMVSLTGFRIYSKDCCLMEKEFNTKSNKYERHNRQRKWISRYVRLLSSKVRSLLFQLSPFL